LPTVFIPESWALMKGNVTEFNNKKKSSFFMAPCFGIGGYDCVYYYYYFSPDRISRPVRTLREKLLYNHFICNHIFPAAYFYKVDSF